MRIKNYHVTPFILAILIKTIIQTPNQTWLFHVYPNYCKKKVYLSNIKKTLCSVKYKNDEFIIR